MRLEDRPDLYGIDKCARPGPDFEGGLKFLVIGDSYAGDTVIALRNAYPEAFFGYFVVPGCPLPDVMDLRSKSRLPCLAHYRHMVEAVLPDLEIDSVLLVSNREKVSDQTLDDWIALARRNGHKVGIIGGRPVFRERVPQIIERFEGSGNLVQKANELIVEDSRDRNARLADRMTQLGISYFDIFAAACDDVCNTFRCQRERDLQGQVAFQRA